MTEASLFTAFHGGSDWQCVQYNIALLSDILNTISTLHIKVKVKVVFI